MKIIRKEDTFTKEWSGGTTTQLAICPPDADYADRDFVWRLSTAVVRDEESTFTPLPDYHRLLTLREGCLELRHDDDAWYILPVGQIASFDGGSKTVSRGRVTDFNLMLRKGIAVGSLAVRSFEKGETDLPLGEMFFEDRSSQNGQVQGLFVSHGKIFLQTNKKTEIQLSAGDLILYTVDDTERPEVLRVSETSLLIGIRIVCDDIEGKR